MTTLNAALNFNFASAEASRIASAERGADDTIAAQIRQSGSDSAFQAGTTITARYQYKVAEDGSLVPTQTQITADAPDNATQGGSRQRNRAYREDDRKATLGDLAKPKADISPSDEVALFSGEQAAPTVAVNAAAQQPIEAASAVVSSEAEVLDENGDPVEAELLKSNSDSASGAGTFTYRQQYAVAGLYARNSDIAYNITPLAAFAA